MIIKLSLIIVTTEIAPVSFRENKTNRNAKKAMKPFTKPNIRKSFQINSSLKNATAKATGKKEKFWNSINVEGLTSHLCDNLYKKSLHPRENNEKSAKKIAGSKLFSDSKQKK